MNDWIKIKGARENNLKNVDLDIPKNKLIVMTGVSGSGKTSLAFDTLYKEGQRRYMESLSAYARQFLGNFEKPDVDSIEGLSPSISIDQRTTSNNPRSTVGTVTEIYDYLRLLYARCGTPYCPGSNEPVSKQTIDEMTTRVMELENKTRFYIVAPVIERQKGTFKKELSLWLKDGFPRVFIDGKVQLTEEVVELDKNKNHDISLVTYRGIMNDEIRSQVYEAIEAAAKIANGKVHVIYDDKTLSFNQNYSCPGTDFVIPDLEPRLFSFNTPIGACHYCNGLGVKGEITKETAINLEKPILQGGFIPFANSDEENLQNQEIETLYKHLNIDINKPLKDIDETNLNIILYGTNEKIHFKFVSKNSGRIHEKVSSFEGVLNTINRRYRETTSKWIREWLENYLHETTCPVCNGARLNEGALSVKVNGINIYEMTLMSVSDILSVVENLNLSDEKRLIGKLAIDEIRNRLSFLNDVGLGYLNLARSAGTLSGGEAQRIRLATQIGSKLSGILYVLDEPSIGLHQKDNDKLIATLKKMRDLGNTLVVVEHDHDTMEACDYLIDIGPGAGELGGEVIAFGTPEDVKNNPRSITGKYLSHELSVSTPARRRPGSGKDIVIIGARENNLKDITVAFPLNKLILVTGVSGSGKSTLVNEILGKGLMHKIYKSKDLPGKHTLIQDYNYIDRVVEISQSPIGRTPRSNPATYTGVFDDIRSVYANTVESKMRGYQKGRFSFNVRGGRCEECSGDGVKRISMHFLPDVFVPCSACGGTRYNSDTLQIKFRGKNIADALNMTIHEAVKFFDNHPKIKHKLQVMEDVGLGYIRLGQSATTLSGGEAQRVKLASELYRKITPSTLYILDEPTTGLHTDDVNKLLKVLHTIVDQGATMIVIEHNLDVIKNADYIIDLGKEGGQNGGYVIASGTPEDVARCKDSYTGMYLKRILS